MVPVFEPSKPKRIVLVDDEEALAWSLSSRLQKARPGDKVVTANDGVHALTHMQQGAPDLLIADIRMPGMSGIDLILSARNVWPELPVIVMTAFKSAEVSRLKPGSFTGFLEKPFEFEKLLKLVQEALAPAQVGFSGAIFVQTLPDVVQLYVLSSATGMLSIKHEGDEGQLWFDRGSITHAITQTTRGDEAFYEIMMWSGGEFTMRAGSQTSEKSVHSNWQELLIESCRRIDEKERNRTSDPRVKGWTRAPPSLTEIEALDFDLDAAFGDVEPRTAKVVPPSLQNNNVQIVRPVRTTPTLSTSVPKEESPTMNVKDSLAKLNSIDGFIGAAVVDSESGMLLGSEGGGNINLEVAAAGNTEVIRAKRKTMTSLALKDQIEDVLISLGKQYHLIRPLRARPNLFFYVALDRQRANLAMARIALSDVEKELQV